MGEQQPSHVRGGSDLSGVVGIEVQLRAGRRRWHPVLLVAVACLGDEQIGATGQLSQCWVGPGVAGVGDRQAR